MTLPPEILDEIFSHIFNAEFYTPFATTSTHPKLSWNPNQLKACHVNLLQTCVALATVGLRYLYSRCYFKLVLYFQREGHCSIIPEGAAVDFMQNIQFRISSDCNFTMHSSPEEIPMVPCEAMIRRFTGNKTSRSKSSVIYRGQCARQRGCLPLIKELTGFQTFTLICRGWKDSHQCWLDNAVTKTSRQTEMDAVLESLKPTLGPVQLVEDATCRDLIFNFRPKEFATRILNSTTT